MRPTCTETAVCESAYNEASPAPSSVVNKMWAILGDKYTACQSATPILPGAQYSVDKINGTIFFTQMDISLDDFPLLE